MKKVLSLVLCLSLLVSLFAGLGIKSAAADVSAIRFNSVGNIICYEGVNTSNDFDYYSGQYHYYERYNIGPHQLKTEGNELIIEYDDESSESFTCSKFYRSDNEDDYELRFLNEAEEEFDLNQLWMDTKQSAENQWSVGNTYSIDIVYMEKRASVNVSVVENPVKNVILSYERPLQVYEHANGQDEYDDIAGKAWFNYAAYYSYMNKAGVSLQVEYQNGEVKTYAYRQADMWNLTDENGERINDEFLRLDFNQWENHYEKDSENKAEIKFYGKGGEIPVEVIPEGEINEGNLPLNEEKYVFTYSDEDHYLSITPEHSGSYEIRGSLRDRIVYDNDFSYRMICAEDSTQIDSFGGEDLIFTLEAGKEYRFVFNRNMQNDVRQESIRLEQASCVTALSFQPVEDIEVYEGDLFDQDLIYKKGNKIAVTFSNGVEEEFTCDNNNNFVNADYLNFEDFARNQGMDNVPRVYGEPSSSPWSKDGEQFIEIFAANGRTTVPVRVVSSPIKAIAFSLAEPIRLFDGTQHSDWGEAENGEWRDYSRFDINKWDLESEGNSITLTYPDDSTKVFECRSCEVENDEGWTDYRLMFVSEDGEMIYAGDLIVNDNQSPDNEWVLGGEYQLELFYKGQKTYIPVSVVENPIKALSVSVDGGKLTLFENTLGHYDYNPELDLNFFRYDEHRDYLRSKNAVLRVELNDGTITEYRFYDYDWEFSDGEGKYINDKDFEFSFGDQWQYPLSAGGENYAYIRYLGKECSIPLEIVPVSDIDDGEIRVNEIKKLFFVSSENHRMSLTVDKNGYYSFDEGLGWDISHNDGFFYSLTDGEKEIPAIDGKEMLTFKLEAGKTYSLSISFDAEHRDDLPKYEYFKIVKRTVVEDFTFIPAGGKLTAKEGDIGGSKEVYRRGNACVVTYSNGDEITFTVGDDGRFRNEDGIELEDYSYRIGVEENCNPYCEANMPSWRTGEDTFISIRIGTVEKTVPVEVESSEIESITYHNAKALVIYDAEMWFDTWNNFTEFYGHPFRTGDSVSVTYCDDRGTVEYNYDGDNRFRNPLDGADEVFLDFSFDEHRQYNVGDTIGFTLSLEKGRAVLTASVAENPVDTVSFEPNTINIFKESRGEFQRREYYNDETGETVIDEFFRYDDGNSILRQKGNKLTVGYTNGTSKVFTCNGDDFIAEDGEIIDFYYLRTYSDQEFNHWLEGMPNILYINYFGRECYTRVNLVEREEWTKQAIIYVDDKAYYDGDTIYIEQDKPIFLSFYTDDRNMDNGVAPMVGFSDGYEGGTLTSAGFDAETGNADQLGFPYGDLFGLRVSSGGLPIGATGVLNFNLYELPENFDWESFDFVNTPHALDCSVTIKVSDHIWSEQTVDPTCTEKGYTLHKCEICGENYKENFVTELGHDFSAKVISEESLRTPESEHSKATYYYSCSRCGEIDRSGDNFFTDPRCTIEGRIGSDFYRELTVELVKSEEVIARVTLVPGEGREFRFDYVEPGEYDIVISGAGFTGTRISSVNLSESEDINLTQSENSFLRALAVPLGDINLDNFVDISDVSILLSEENFGKASDKTELVNINADEVININDLAILLGKDNYGAGINVINY